MLLNSELLNVLDGVPTSYIDFNIAEASTRFVKIFYDKWEEAVLKVLDNYYDFDEYDMEEFKEENEAKIYVFHKDFGFRAVFEPLYIIDQWDARAWSEEPCEALALALNQIREEFPDIEYKGCVQFVYSDTHCGDIVQYEINVDKDYIHPYIGEVLNHCFQDYEFWSDLQMYTDDKEGVKNDLLNYKAYFEEDTEYEIDNL